MEKINKDTLVGTNDMCEILGITRPMIGNLGKVDVLVSAEARGKWYLCESIQNWGTYRANARTGGNSSLADEKIRLVSAQADLTQLNVKERDGLLIEIEKVNQELMEVMTVAGNMLDGVSGQLASELSVEDDAGTIRAIILKEMRRIRKEIANGLTKIVGGDIDG